MDFHFITRVVGFRESNMQMLGGQREKIVGLINCQILLSEKYLDKTSFTKIVHAHSNW